MSSVRRHVADQQSDKVFLCETYPFSLLLQLITEVYFRKYQESEYLQYTVSGNWYIQLLYLVCIYSSILHTRSEHGSSVLEPY